MGSKQYPGSQPADVLAAEMQEVSAGVYRKLLGDQTPERNHVVEIQAHTRKGWGDKIRKTTTTVKYSCKLVKFILIKNIFYTFTDRFILPTKAGIIKRSRACADIQHS